ncbi:MAG TPA: ABC transporter substrate-binding protein [Acidimicrobiales bacterium]|nr:ABC transporter substrate-binding protein [Acidimicrobiales bacterium]
MPVAAPQHPGQTGASALPRDRTLYASGTETSPPSNFNPLDVSKAYTGTQGLLYEPLFLYDPVHGKFIPWLASSGGWVNATTYKLQVRSDVNWVNSTDGSVNGALTGADVAYSVTLAAKDKADPYYADVAGVKSATATGGSVTVKFARPVEYAQWQQFLFQAPIVPQAVWSKLTPAAQLGGPNMTPVSTGPMLLASTSPTEACYRDNPNWWARGQLGLSFKFEYLCDVVTRSSGDDLSALIDNRTDWSNELLRGVPDLVGGKTNAYGIKTYYPGAPYMLPAGTAWLEMNTAKAPMSNADFRKAVAYAIDPSAVISGVYTGAVSKTNPTGLLPYLSPFINNVAVKSYGFSYSPSMAEQFLDKSGYNGQHLTLEVPEGGTDWMQAATDLSAQLTKIGIHVTAKSVPLDTRDADLSQGNFDMAIAEDAVVSPTPWTYFDTIYHLPINTVQDQGLNIERFSDASAWALVQQAAATPVTDTALLRSIYAVVEADFLQELPVVPLWYSGAWFQASTAYWEDFPASTSRLDQNTPMMGPGWLGSTTTVYALANLKPH